VCIEGGKNYAKFYGKGETNNVLDRELISMQ